MIIDVNSSLGHYPFRSLRNNHAASMVELMDRYGIDQSLVCSLHALFYRDAQRGNQELYEELQEYRSRLIPVATVNPRYVGWQHDLQVAVEEWHMRAVALVPAYHDYELQDPYGQAALAQCAELGIPVVLTQRFEDRRQRHHWDIADDLAQSAILQAARTHPNLKMMLCNWLGLDGDKLRDAGLQGRCLIDIARMDVFVHHGIPDLIDKLGVESLAFGSHAPFDYVGPSLIKLAALEGLPEEGYQAVAWRNAAQFFQLDRP